MVLPALVGDARRWMTRATTRCHGILFTGLFRQGVRSVRSQLARSVRHVLARHNLVLLNPRHRFGIDYLTDIERLANVWSYSVDTFFDVGANVGDTALSAFKKFPEVRVYSFEPHPSTFSILQQRIESRSKFFGENVALGVANGSIDMFEYDACTLNSLVPNAQYAVRFGQAGRRIQVRCTTLSSYCQDRGIDRIDVLKIDTEGYDLTVLQGAEQMLAKGAIRFVYVEFNDLHLQEGATGGALLPIGEFLRDYGLRFIASYNDYIVTEGELFSVSNALFAAPPNVFRDRDMGREGLSLSPRTHNHRANDL
jgi:FkbM family methyltransferase